MPVPILTRRSFTLSALSTPFLTTTVWAQSVGGKQALITAFGAKADGATINTTAIQAAIDHLAGRGGGTVVVPRGVFVSGALFLKPRVDLHLEAGAVLKCTNAMENFPPRRTRIEGHFEPSFTPALINADGCHGLKITGEGTLDGSGRPVWDLFWKMRAAAPDPSAFKNVGLPRARLVLIENSKDVTIEGVTFKDSQFWNLHLYRCDGVEVRQAHFHVPDDYKQAPSTDGIDLDSCRNVLVDGCTFSVTDDCIAAKGSKGPHALEDKDSPPVEHIRVQGCHFRRGHQAFTCGSEATLVRDVVVENCRLTSAINLLMLKLRADTPQHYEDIHLRNITLDADGGRLLLIEPWAQYANLQGMTPPKSLVRNVSLSDVTGRFGAFGIIRPNPGQTDIGGILVQRVHVDLKDPQLAVSGMHDLRFEDVVVNGKPMPTPVPGPAAPAPAGGYRASGA
ncbi:glycoside hydrolase family 28 protein [Sphingomonas sp. BAUL-RG-20F-R05-02]|uniref:glycoside hydrolase family 28 protein n=1 Tax=Sphingomonas sp. BAUL-RG-20F-R05-02 TaxID=2914830 RepID=UPI001F57B02E|nr:glycosyl hydrolase family 28 protein [Sphingomonas sp. BAUL-RG-20F-R05-02]